MNTICKHEFNRFLLLHKFDVIKVEISSNHVSLNLYLFVTSCNINIFKF